MDKSVIDPAVIKRRVIVTNIVFTLFLIPLPVLIIATLYIMSMIPGAQDSMITLILALSFFSYIPIYITSLVGSWVAYYFEHYNAAQLLGFLPIFDILLSVIGILLLIFICDGSFVCRQMSYTRY
ncbi:hypothetical protein [Candidatus Albibeggiatoa sp. nov. BB20]|uniref:hypothetical protein n=1 Tax=Candidatus Albibeggiatoa sp. nov. BB20 TaxID=3162723 RepID=UPI003365A72D